ncbi:hypothetical protein D3C78_1099640 [compost metagenome]
MAKADRVLLDEYLEADSQIKDANKQVKDLQAALEKEVLAKYPTLTETDIKTLVIQHKWTPVLQQALNTEQEKQSQNLTQRIKELAGRYETALPALEAEVLDASEKVKAHLQKMGLVW